MKKFLSYIAFTFFLAGALLASRAAEAKPLVETFSNNERDMSKIVTLLVTPLVVNDDIPEEEHFFYETITQTWATVIKTSKIDSRFALKTPEQLAPLEQLFGGASGASADIDGAERAPSYADAVITLTVTDAHQGIIAHGEQVRWIPSVRLGGGYWHDSWHPRGGMSLQRERVPAYDEFYAAAALKIEIRDARDGADTLLYGISARDMARSGMMPVPPSLTRLTDNLIRAAAAELAKVKP